MISYIKGIIVSKTENSPFGCNIVVEANNIGYFIQTNKRVIASLPAIEQAVTIYTTLIHREDSMQLCGFINKEDRDLFNILQNVSGIGVKVALKMLEELSAPELISAVIRGADKELSRTKGVGSKLAQKIILELKDKMTNWRDKSDFILEESQKFDSNDTKEAYIEAESVLLSLGYSKNETDQSLSKAISSAENKNDPEELLRYALQWLATE